MAATVRVWWEKGSVRSCYGFCISSLTTSLHQRRSKSQFPLAVFGFICRYLLDLYQQFIFSLTQFNQSRFFVFVSQEDLWVWRLRFTLLEIGLVVGFMGLVVLLEIWVWFFVGDWFCRRSVFLWLLGFVLIWRLVCVLHVWLLRKCKKGNKNIDFLNFWARFARKKMKNMINGRTHVFILGKVWTWFFNSVFIFFI